MRQITGDVPKSLLQVQGYRFIDLLLTQLRQAGCSRVVLCTGHGADMFVSELGHSWNGMELVYSREDTPLGTGGALALAKDQIQDDSAFVLNGDTFCACSFVSMRRVHVGTTSPHMTMAVLVNDYDYGHVFLTDVGLAQLVSHFGRIGSSGINVGIYIIDRDLIESIPNGEFVSLENSVFPRWIESGQIHAYTLYGFVNLLDVGKPGPYLDACEYLREKSSTFGCGSLDWVDSAYR